MNVMNSDKISPLTMGKSTNEPEEEMYMLESREGKKGEYFGTTFIIRTIGRNQLRAAFP